MSLHERLRGLDRREVSTFLSVGGLGYLVDVLAFNVLTSVGPLTAHDPALARTIAVVAATSVTYAGNRRYTWRDAATAARGREVGLFLLFNAVGFAVSVLCLLLSHDVLGLTTRTADNISANVIGVGLGTLFRFVTYRRYVFATEPDKPSSRLPSQPPNPPETPLRELVTSVR